MLRTSPAGPGYVKNIAHEVQSWFFSVTADLFKVLSIKVTSENCLGKAVPVHFVLPVILYINMIVV